MASTELVHNVIYPLNNEFVKASRFCDVNLTLCQLPYTSESIAKAVQDSEVFYNSSIKRQVLSTVSETMSHYSL
jgi:hypothetical protein